MELYAAGVISDVDELAKCLAQVAAEQDFLEEPMAAARAVSGAHTRRSGRDDFESLRARFEAAWPGNRRGFGRRPNTRSCESCARKSRCGWSRKFLRIPPPPRARGGARAAGCR